MTQPPDPTEDPGVHSSGSPRRPSGLGSEIGRWVGAGVLAFDALARASRTTAGPALQRVLQRVAALLRPAGWWLAWVLVATVEAVDRGVRAAARAHREGLPPELADAWHRAAGTLRVAEARLDRRVTLASITAHTWSERARDGLAVLAEVHLPRARRRGVAQAHVAAQRAQRAWQPTFAPGRGAFRPRRATAWGTRRRVAVSHFALVLLVVAGSLGAARTFGPQAVEVAAEAVDVDVTEPGALPPLTERSVVVDADGAVLSVLHDAENRKIVPLEEIPEHVRDAVVAAEDHRFYDHDGFDVVALGRAAGANIEATGVVQGGSTITQQLAKQNFVGDDRSIDRKVKELFHAIGLEEAHDKDELLERYLNQVYFGSGAYGIAAAAEEFFRVEPADLTVGQAALLAGQIRAPAAVDPRGDRESAAARRRQVLQQMVAAGHIEPGEAEQAASEPIEVAPPLHDEAPSEPYFVEAVKREFLANPAFGETREERLEALFTGGLRIETTLHQRLQDLARDTVAAHVEALGGPTAALAAVQPGTGRLLAMSAAGDFDERKFDIASQGRRQPGSAFKTFALVAALEAGVEPDVRLDGDGPEEHELPNGQVWTVHNFEGSEHGEVDLRQALVSSVNTAFAELTMEVGHERVVDVGNRLGIGEGAFGEASTHGPSVALGGLTHGVSPVEMAAAYAALGHGGRYAGPFLVERVVDADGEVVFAKDIDAEQVIAPAVAATTLDLLQSAVTEGTGQAAQIPGWPVAGKTGTTQNSADAWFAGTTPPLSAAVWVGHPDEQTPVPGLTGGAAAAPVWRDFVAAALDGAEPTGFGG